MLKLCRRTEARDEPPEEKDIFELLAPSTVLLFLCFITSNSSQHNSKLCELPLSF